MVTSTKPQRAGNRASSSPYHQAANILNQLLWVKTSRRRTPTTLKSLVYSTDGHMTCSKSCYAQVCNVLKHQSELEDMIHASGILQNNQVSNQGLVYVLVYELLLGPKRRLQGGGAVKRLVMEYQDQLAQAMEAWKQRHGSGGAAGTLSPKHPRYIRVNTLSWTTERVLQHIRRLLQEHSGDTKDVESEGNHCADALVYLDRHVPDLLVVSPQVTSRLLQDSVLSTSNHAVVWQDKSSCFSALCLAEGWAHDGEDDGDYLDACAAPGNKTLHLAALLQGRRDRSPKRDSACHQPTTIHALDRSSDRHRVLRQRIRQYTSKERNERLVQVVAHHQDCLRVRSEDYANVRHVLLDPTCSGSGVVTDAIKNSKTHTKEQEDDETNQRISSLSNFQVTCLKHFMSFPSVDRIVYSTCSVNVLENEQVVAQALSSSPTPWTIHAPVCLQHWHRRGVCTEGLTQEQTDAMVRVDPHEDGTNGFFVCCLERSKEGDATAPVRREPGTNPIEQRIARDASQLDVSLYRSEFHAESQRGEEDDLVQRESSGVASPRGLVGSAVAPGVTSQPTLLPPRKVAKKLDWKRRQREAKWKRMVKKQAQKQNA